MAIVIVSAVKAQSGASEAADRQAIRTEIESIFQAFIDGDVQKIHDTHSGDWFGFLENSRVPIQGLDAYMKANGIAWPADLDRARPPVPTDPSRRQGYAVHDFELQFLTPDLALACFTGDFTQTERDVVTTTARYRILDVYARRDGRWIQVASHTVVDPQFAAASAAAGRTSAQLPAAVTKPILDARDAVWRAYFANDRAALERLIPTDVIAMGDGGREWGDRAAVLSDAQAFASSGGKLVSLAFPKSEIQYFGAVIVVYTTYRYETDRNGERKAASGDATQVFVRRSGVLVNVGWHLDGGALPR